MLSTESDEQNLMALSQEGRDCETLAKDLEIFTPDTPAEIDFLEALRDPSNLSPEEVEAYGKAVGFESLEEFKAFFVTIIKSDCDFASREGTWSRRENCGLSLYLCIVGAVNEVMSDLDEGATTEEVFIPFVVDIVGCAVGYLECTGK